MKLLTTKNVQLYTAAHVGVQMYFIERYGSYTHILPHACKLPSYLFTNQVISMTMIQCIPLFVSDLFELQFKAMIFKKKKHLKLRLPTNLDTLRSSCVPEQYFTFRKYSLQKAWFPL